MSASNLTMYIVVNTTVKMTKGKIAAQVGHAVASVVETMLHDDPLRYSLYKRDGQPKIVLGAKEELLHTIAQMRSAHPIYDAGKTGVVAGTLTAVAFEPTDSNNSFFKSLKLL